MRHIRQIIVIACTAFALSSCATYSRETRLVEPQSDFRKMWIARHIEINELPRITLTSSCVDEQALFIGPYFVIPLPVIPNITWPFKYAAYKKQSAWLNLIIKAPPKMLNWDGVIVAVSLNGRPLTQDRSTDNFNAWYEERSYFLKPGNTCGEIEEGEITVTIEGLPVPIKSTIMLKHRWLLKAEG